MANIIKSVLGAKTYGVWMTMLKSLVPHGRTHRLAVVVAGMLQCAYHVASRKKESCSRSRKFLSLYERSIDDPEEEMNTVIKLAEALFKDAGVQYERVNSKGNGYSIAESAAHEFMNWENMPWE